MGGASIPEQHDALGRLGVNLIDAASRRTGLIAALGDGLSRSEIEIDALRFEGPAFAGIDGREVGLALLRRGLADSILFAPDGRMVPADEETYGATALIYRSGTGAPVERLKERLAGEAAISPSKVMTIAVMRRSEFLQSGTSASEHRLVVNGMNAAELRRYAMELKTGRSAIALQGEEDDAVDEDPAGSSGRKAPLATYRY
jgi:hypothetical protein